MENEIFSWAHILRTVLSLAAVSLFALLVLGKLLPRWLKSTRSGPKGPVTKQKLLIKERLRLNDGVELLLLACGTEVVLLALLKSEVSVLGIINENGELSCLPQKLAPTGVEDAVKLLFPLREKREDIIN